MDKGVGYVDAAYLEAAAGAQLFRKERSYELMHVQAGQKVLDVGCGAGIDTLSLAKLVQANGKVIGVDHDQEMIDQANGHAEAAGVGAFVSHRKADAAQLPFESDFFDSCRSERLFQHLQEPGPVLAEMIRVTRPSGWIVVVDTDWGTLSADTPEAEAAYRYWGFVAMHGSVNAFAGRKLYRMFKEQQLVNLVVEPYTLYLTDYGFASMMMHDDGLDKMAVERGVVSAEELARLYAGFEKANEQGTFFATCGYVMLAGQKPACA